MHRNSFIFFFLIVIISVFTYGLTNTYFQQDEWNGFGTVIHLSHQPFTSWFNILGAIHFIPLSQFFWFIMYKVFGYNASFYAVTALALHAIASFLVFLLAKKLTMNEWIGFVTAILFATNARSAQTFTYLVVFVATITCFIFIMLFFLYLAKEKNRTKFSVKNLVVLLLLFFAAVFCREDGLILIPLFPIFLWLFQRKVFNKNNIWFFATFFLFTIGFFLYRVALQFLTVDPYATANHGYGAAILYNFVSLPFKLIVQNLFNWSFIYESGWQIKNIIYPVELSQITRDTVFWDVTIGVFFAFIAVAFLLLVKIKLIPFKKISNIFLFAIAWIVISAFLLSSVGRQLWMVESRYLYLSSFGVLLILAITFYYLIRVQHKNMALDRFKKIAGIILFAFLFVNSYLNIQEQIKLYLMQSAIRKQVVSEITRLHPTIPKDAIFFVKCKDTCTKNSQIGLPNEYVMPFSSGPGWIILLQYARQNEHGYAPFFTKEKGKEFLWDFGAEGYKKKGEYSFGYFITPKLLKETIENEKLDKRIIIGLEYDDKNITMRDISKEIQNEIK